jgi:hypothetical protein
MCDPSGEPPSPDRPGSLRGRRPHRKGPKLFKWSKSPRTFRVVLFLGAIASFVVAAGAGTRWG